MRQAQLAREEQGAGLSPEDFARDQQSEVTLAIIDTIAHGRFPRARELINKTNPFNTGMPQRSAPTELRPLGVEAVIADRGKAD